jgi:multicomponent Na+:H+ antiporter subunit B
MNRRWRTAALAASGVALLPAAWAVIAAMPAFGEHVSPYGAAINAIVPAARHVSNMVAAVNFDLRGLDTLGEESMLLCAVTGTVVLLRGSRGEGTSRAAVRLPGRAITQRADATILICRFAATLLFFFGVYVALHGLVTPGGGFQGGVIIASSLLLLYLGEGYAHWRSIVRGRILSFVEGAGALLFVLAGAIPLAFGKSAFQNILPLGTFRDLYAGGAMVVINAAVTCAVAGGFTLILLEFMEETRAPETEREPGEGG